MNVLRRHDGPEPRFWKEALDVASEALVYAIPAFRQRCGPASSQQVCSQRWRSLTKHRGKIKEVASRLRRSVSECGGRSIEGLPQSTFLYIFLTEDLAIIGLSNNTVSFLCFRCCLLSVDLLRLLDLVDLLFFSSHLNNCSVTVHDGLSDPKFIYPQCDPALLEVMIHRYLLH